MTNRDPISAVALRIAAAAWINTRTLAKNCSTETAHLAQAMGDEADIELDSVLAEQGVIRPDELVEFSYWPADAAIAILINGDELVYLQADTGDIVEA